MDVPQFLAIPMRLLLRNSSRCGEQQQNCKDYWLPVQGPSSRKYLRENTTASNVGTDQQSL